MAQTTQVATRQPSSFEVELQSYEPQFAAALPSHIPPEKFRRTVITALNAQPDLANADRRSLFTACVRAAQDGLFPDGREAALVIFNTKDRKTGEWRKLVQYLPMVGGLIKRMRNSGELAAISAYVVFSEDAFDYELGDEPRLSHKPAMGDRGKPIGAYAIAKLTNGEVLREVMSIAEIEKVRQVSRAKDDGPWRDWWEEMARKTVIRRLSKRLPSSADVDDVMRHEEDQYREPPKLVPDLRPVRAAFAALNYEEEEAALPQPEHDVETGEVTDQPPAASDDDEPSLLPELAVREDGSINWTQWAALVMTEMREADKARLGDLRKAMAAVDDCPAPVLADIDRAFDARRKELRA